MGVVDDRLASEGLVLPAVAPALGSYLPAVRTGSLVFTSGQLPVVEGVLEVAGAVGGELPAEVAAAAARRCALNALAAASTVCSLDEVTRVVKVTGYVVSAPGFCGQPAVINGASEIMIIAFGEAGRHSREAVGVAELPLGAPVEVSLVLEIGSAS
ncbi:MAG: RidA family protein [Coriobacteriia bacterium]|nr:RidA family protein [Coriobacteriia bacterium]